MGWSRDLGVVNAADVVSAALSATAAATGRLSDEESARRAALVAALSTGESLSAADLAELSRLNAARSAAMSPEEAATITLAAETAAEAVRRMGGRAHVSIGGSSRIEQQPEAPIKGVRQTSITVTVSTTSGDGAATGVTPHNAEGRPDPSARI